MCSETIKAFLKKCVFSFEKARFGEPLPQSKVLFSSIALYLAPSIFILTLTSFPVLAEKKHLHQDGAISKMVPAASFTEFSMQSTMFNLCLIQIMCFLVLVEHIK
ncbi:hypothetical protein ILYODFUR_026584 [Ilyodon furcidens]|uniref:Uncharacterized protein n=1 Tax=Ilyodon furcidens TaxID=33524 RepID=A0ABV0UCV4_9TELE